MAKRKPRDVIDYYLDESTYIPLKQITKTTFNNQEMETETCFSNYEMIDGIAMPMSMKNTAAQFSSQIIFDSIEFNADVPDKLFEKPTSYAPKGQ